MQSYQKESNTEEKSKSEKLSESNIRSHEIKTVKKATIDVEEKKLLESKSTKKIMEAQERSEDSSSESEGCDGPVLDDDSAEGTFSSGLNVSSVDHAPFLPSNWDDDLIPDTFPSGKRRHHKRNLVLEGSCNYFFWMEKIAMVRKLG